MGKMSYESHENPAYYNIITVVSGYALTLLVLLSLFSPYGKITGRTPRMVAGFNNIYPRNGQHPLVLFIEHCSHFVFTASQRASAVFTCYPFIRSSPISLPNISCIWSGKTQKQLRYTADFSPSPLFFSLSHFLAVRLGLVPDSIFHGGTRRRAYSLHERDESKYLTQHRPHHRHLPTPLIAASVSCRTIREKKESGMNVVYATLFVYSRFFMSLDGVTPARHTEHQIGQRNGGRYPGNSFGQQDLFLCSCRSAPFLHGQFPITTTR